MSIAILHHPDCILHEMGAGHPEQPARITAIREYLDNSDLQPLLEYIEARPIRRDQLIEAHDAAYIDSIYAAAPASDLVWLDGDTAMNPNSLKAAEYSAGAAVMGVDMVMSGAHDQVFTLTRPPGHHAERDKAMGFCFFNNVAVAAKHALEEWELDRVAIVDFDVHHGNGTEDIVAGDDRILFCSSFQHPFYPGTGADSTASNIINIPLPAGTEGPAFRAAVEAQWLPRLDDFSPELILISAGFDGHRADQLAQFNLLEEDYAWITGKLFDLSEEHAIGRIVSCLEGGYELDALSRSVYAHLNALFGN